MSPAARSRDGATRPRALSSRPVKHALLSLLALAGALAAGAAQAQAYRCSNGNAIYYSDRPCSGPPPSKLGAYGGGSRSQAERAPSPGYLPRAGKPQEHVKYLSSECSDIAEAIRTAPARGVRGDVISGLRDEYQQKCALQDEEARRQHRQDERARSDQLRAERESLALKRDEARRQSEQCNGMRDVIALKRSREKSLNETEVAALRSLESSYNGRCLNR